MEPQILRVDQLTFLLETLRGRYQQAHITKTPDDRAAARRDLESSIATTREALQRLAQQGTGHDLDLARLERELMGCCELASASLRTTLRPG